MNGAGQTGNLATFNSTAHIATVSDFSLVLSGVTSISNLSVLAALTTFNCHGNAGLTTLDVTGNPLLETLVVYSCGLTALDVTNCTALTYLECGSNQLTALDVSNCILLNDLECYSNFIPSLDITSCPLISYLDYSFNATDATAVDDVLCALASAAVNSGTADVSNNSAPTGIGLACLATLEGVPRGPWTVSHD
jgi:Leucine-rich repeat (LRR) protein